MSARQERRYLLVFWKRQMPRSCSADEDCCFWYFALASLSLNVSHARDALSRLNRIMKMKTTVTEKRHRSSWKPAELINLVQKKRAVIERRHADICRKVSEEVTRISSVLLHLNINVMLSHADRWLILIAMLSCQNRFVRPFHSDAIGFALHGPILKLFNCLPFPSICIIITSVLRKLLAAFFTNRSNSSAICSSTV